MTAKATLPAHWYTDTTIARRERERIFARNWIAFGPEHDVHDVGQCVAKTVHGWPILLTRAADGLLRAFHNVCRHRAAMLLPSDSSRCMKRIVCPYHGWTYDLDGRLFHSAGFGAELDKAATTLLPVHVNVWRGMVFVCVAESPPDLMTWLGVTNELCDEWPETHTMRFHGEFTVEGAANWKTYCDNTVEGYHLSFVHPRLSSAVQGANVDIRGYADGEIVGFHVTYRGDGAGLRGSRGLWLYRYPGFQLVIGPNAFKAERIEPIGAGRLRSTSWAWFTPDLGADERNDSFAWAERIVREDLGICETVQTNLEAGFYRHGYLSPRKETHTATFQDLVRRDLAMKDDVAINPTRSSAV